MSRLADLRVKIFADGADYDGMVRLSRNPLIKGFTTNPSLMRKAGVSDYEAFARHVLGTITDRPVSFEVFVRPTLLRMQGRRVRERPVIALPAGTAWRTPPGRRQYLPVTIDRTDPRAWRAVPATSGGSHLAGGLGRAEAYAVVPAEVETVAEGDVVDVMLIS